MNPLDHLIGELPPVRRLALGYAPAAARGPTLGLLALDARLGAIVRAAREPMLAQLRLGWWRDVLAKPPVQWPAGEPLLAALKRWEPERATLAALVDGWEEMALDPPLELASFQQLAGARGDAFAALARLLGHEHAAARAGEAGREWALADLAAGVGDPREQALLMVQTMAIDWTSPKMARSLRPLIVLRGMAWRRISRSGQRPGYIPSDMLFALRLGLLGR